MGPRAAVSGGCVVADPAGEAGFVDLAGGEATDHHHGFGLVGEEIDVAEAEKGDEGQERSALVAFDERMIPGDTESVGRRKLGQIDLRGIAGIGDAIDRPGADSSAPSSRMPGGPPNSLS